MNGPPMTPALQIRAESSSFRPSSAAAQSATWSRSDRSSSTTRVEPGPSRRRGCLLAFGRIAHRQHDVGAAPDELAGRLEADAAVGAGHDEGASRLLSQLSGMPAHARSVRAGRPSQEPASRRQVDRSGLPLRARGAQAHGRPGGRSRRAGGATGVRNDMTRSGRRALCSSAQPGGTRAEEARRVIRRSAVVPLRSGYSQLVERTGREPAERDETSATGANGTAYRRSHNPSAEVRILPRPIAALAFLSTVRRPVHANISPHAQEVVAIEAMTSQGSPYARFRCALTNGNPLMITAACAELPCGRGERARDKRPRRGRRPLRVHQSLLEVRPPSLHAFDQHGASWIRRSATVLGGRPDACRLESRGSPREVVQRSLDAVQERGCELRVLQRRGSASHAGGCLDEVARWIVDVVVCDAG